MTRTNREMVQIFFSIKISPRILFICFQFHEQIDSLLKEWNIDIKGRRELFLDIANVLTESKSSSKDSFKFLTKYLATFSGEDAHTIGEANVEAVHAIIEFVKAPDTFQCDLLYMTAIGQLEKDAKYASVYQLLKICLTQWLDAYLEFEDANSSLLKSYAWRLLAKMRLMSLVDLGCNESVKIPYSLIKDTLKIYYSATSKAKLNPKHVV